MELIAATTALAALGHASRQMIFRRLVQAGSQGCTPGTLVTELAMPPATLSFHLKQLNQAGLLSARQEGRHIHYVADYLAMSALLGYLTENCCAGQTCGVEMPACFP